MSEPLVEVVRVFAMPEYRATAFDQSIGRLTYRTVVGWIELDHMRYPADMLYVRLEFAEERLKYAYAKNQEAAGCRSA